MINTLRNILGTKKPVTVEVEAGLNDCSVCNGKNVSMIPLYISHADVIKKFFIEYQKNQTVHNIFHYETFNMNAFTCSNCGANDKDRLYALYMDIFLKQNNVTNLNMLDIAPTPQLTGFLKKKQQINYRSMDLYMEIVDDKVDITDMNIYQDGRFDFFICSHVLEHVPEDIRAMRELYRILKMGGKGIVMVPINLGVEKTLEDPYCTDIPARWKYFGQDDHIRMYAKQDFISRLKSVGFKIDLLDVNYFGAEIFEKFAVYPTSVLYVVTK
jgi:SAM-dependent methyltransferase